MMFFFKIFLAHLMGDFLLQPAKWVQEKESKKLASNKLYFHIAIHALLLLSIFKFNLAYLVGIGIIVFSHFLIDTLKLYLQNDKTKGIYFFIDQLLHVFVLLAITSYYKSIPFKIDAVLSQQLILFAVVILLLTVVSGLVIKMIINQWNPEDDKDTEGSLEKAGRFIGILERLFVFAFVVTNHWEAIGFLLAAKSVFRFGDLKSSKDRKLTEYILIGTLLSFGLAIFIGIVFTFLITKI